MMVVCPACGSDRLIMLTFSPPLGDEKIDLPRRPVAKCLACGKRIHAKRYQHRGTPRDE